MCIINFDKLTCNLALMVFGSRQLSVLTKIPQMSPQRILGLPLIHRNTVHIKYFDKLKLAVAV